MGNPSQSDTDILAEVRAGFIVKGTTLTQWCRTQGVDPSWAFKVLKGAYVGSQSIKLRRRAWLACQGEKSTANG